ncbi:hypothetical protein PR202_ga30516 [Eleusine coracana subsp. coracana]|uniref:Uncharacterized protein n=1 Tax=Eleusine coracana subsp. coracana TaxID=191504 RepID=A0AAV5DMG1_ELECO|nr:hypothetical protein PR202_ga30482 [Eleusine coracana subsp. coracana]GJN12254.1 hypothetical protein PR202_ga30516 [Eleusine coracana subsp. coracana]
MRPSITYWSTVFLRDNSGISCSDKLVSSCCPPQPSDTSFEEWWNYFAGRVHGEARKKFNTTIILGAWILWRHRNDCIFNGREPNLAAVLILAGNERSWWSLAGAGALAASPAAQAVD